MVDKQHSLYFTLFSLCVSIMIVLMILLFVEYRFFCEQTNALMALKQQYAQYVAILHTKINGKEQDYVDGEEDESVSSTVQDIETAADIDAIRVAEASDEPDNDDEYAEDSFLVINRHPDYLKESTLEYIQSQDLGPLMTAIDIDRWSDTPTVLKAHKKVVPHRSVNQRIQKQPLHTVARSHKDYGFVWPIEGNKFWLSSLFGPRRRIDRTWGFHHGIDMAAVKGTMVKAVRYGIVEEACFNAGYGNTVVIKHDDTLKTRYAHLHTITAYVGQKIQQGAVVGTVGETGFIRKKGKDGSHLHFEVYEHGKRVNPLHYLPRMM
jgi:murein DD-endopeptidase MepM/ murein hydrolase activator NlpD